MNIAHLQHISEHFNIPPHLVWSLKYYSTSDLVVTRLFKGRNRFGIGYVDHIEREIVYLFRPFSTRDEAEEVLKYILSSECLFV